MAGRASILLYVFFLTFILSHSPSCCENQRDRWKHDAERWKRWMPLEHAYSWGVMYSNKYVVETLRAGQEEEQEEEEKKVSAGSSLENVPVFVHNKPSRTDRRRHTEQFLKVVGFTEVEFPPDGPQLDEIAMLEMRLITPKAVESMKGSAQISEHGFLPYARHAIKQIQVIRRAAAANLSLFGVFEDDLMLAYPPSLVRHRISRAVKHLPSTADLLYLEM
eukprot:758048-Hanusia_phi.AAC.5